MGHKIRLVEKNNLATSINCCDILMGCVIKSHKKRFLRKGNITLLWMVVSRIRLKRRDEEKMKISYAENIVIYL